MSYLFSNRGSMSWFKDTFRNGRRYMQWIQSRDVLKWGSFFSKLSTSDSPESLYGFITWVDLSTNGARFSICDFDLYIGQCYVNKSSKTPIFSSIPKDNWQNAQKFILRLDDKNKPTAFVYWFLPLSNYV